MFYTDKEMSDAKKELYYRHFTTNPYFFEEVMRLEKERGKFLEKLQLTVDKLYKNHETTSSLQRVRTK